MLETFRFADQPRLTGHGHDRPNRWRPGGRGPRTTVPGGAHAATPAGTTGRRSRSVPGGVKVKGGGAWLVGFLTGCSARGQDICAVPRPGHPLRGNGHSGLEMDAASLPPLARTGGGRILCGLLTLAKVPSLRNGRGGGSAGLAGFLVVLCGAWLAIGPLAWPLLESGGVFTGGSVWHDFLTRLGYSYGPAVILAMLGGMATGLSVGRRLTGLAMTGSAPVAWARSPPPRPSPQPAGSRFDPEPATAKAQSSRQALAQHAVRRAARSGLSGES